MKRDTLIKTLVRKELDRYVMGYSLRDRMAALLDEVEEWTLRWLDDKRAEGKSVLISTIYGELDTLNRDDFIALLMETDTDNVVKGRSLKDRMTDLQAYAFGWVHDRRVPASAQDGRAA